MLDQGGNDVKFCSTGCKFTERLKNDIFMTFWEIWYSQNILMKNYLEYVSRKSKKEIPLNFVSYYFKNFRKNIFVKVCEFTPWPML